MIRNADLRLTEILENYQPASLLCLSFGEVAAVENHAVKNPGCKIQRLKGVRRLGRRDGLGRYEFAVLADQLGHLTKDEGIHLLGQVRNLCSNRVAVITNLEGNGRKAGSWTHRDFIAMEMELQDSGGDQDGRSLYLYDIETYNFDREWNNAEHWANPENFHKFRW